ncbi:hypothetical protein GNF09_13470, partial [Nostoc sp. UCD120]|nr:hypothetical protein [Nostoc sp. UCD120]
SKQRSHSESFGISPVYPAQVTMPTVQEAYVVWNFWYNISLIPQRRSPLYPIDFLA